MTNNSPTRKLSLFRVFIALLVFAGLSYISVANFENVKEQIIPGDKASAWFAPYVDVTAKPSFPFEQMEIPESQNNVVLSFIVADKDNACTPTWGT